MTRRHTSAGAHLSCALAVVLSTSCASSRIAPEEMEDPALIEIHGALVEAVEWARTNPGIEWYSGWTGNAVVNATDEKTLGLCYEWQELVWDFARPAAERVGWRADGISVNVGTFTEHHAVVVWDPARVDRDSLLDVPSTEPAYVLDAWRRGEPDVYPVEPWIHYPMFELVPAALEDLEAEYGTEPRFGPDSETASGASPGRP